MVSEIHLSDDLGDSNLTVSDFANTLDAAYPHFTG